MRNHTGMTTEEQDMKLSELRKMLALPEYPPIENCKELQPVVREVGALEELIREDDLRLG